MGPAALAIYTVGVQVGQMIHTASVAVFQKAMPRVSRLLAAPPFPAPPNASPPADAVEPGAVAGATLAVLAASRPLLDLMLGPAIAAGHLHIPAADRRVGPVVVERGRALFAAGHGQFARIAILNGLGGLAMLAIMAALAASAGEQAAAWGRMAYAVITLAGVALAIRQSRPEFQGAMPAATR